LYPKKEDKKKLYLPDSHYAQSKNIMISSQGEVSTRAGLEIYKQGGNIIDAFVATSLAISVERPQSTGLGGGGFLLFKKNTNVYVYDFREVAPSAFHFSYLLR
jgi:gamma-glutamyltranspeptidase/glutathione hydrolase